ncbi:MAG: radical SAM protein, partial [Nanoarchaeota archaeon]|nr:radical SAM protein [Nanoarchaeota archaeon]
MKVFIKTFGCQANYADSEVLAGILIENKFKLTDSIKDSDIVIVMSCGVKNITQNRVVSFIRSIPKTKKIYVGGCLPRIIDLTDLNIDGLFDTNSITKILQLINKKQKIIFSDKKESRILKKRINNNIGIVVISQGCLGNCTYCGTKFARGNLKSYPINKIKKEVQNFVKQGCKTINLSSQDNGCYGLDIKTNLPNLLEEIIKI